VSGTGGTYLAVWPVDPDLGLPAARRAATGDLARLAELAGVVLTGPATFTVCAAGSWHGPLGGPGDLLLVACAPARAVPAAEAGSGPAAPGGSVAAEHLPADVTAREHGRRPDRVPGRAVDPHRATPTCRHPLTGPADPHQLQGKGDTP